MMRIKLDENLDHRLAQQLCGLGHDAHSALQERLNGQPDDLVWSTALREQRVLFTLDLDFADERNLPGQDHPGIVLFRVGGLGAAGITRLVLDFALSQAIEEVRGSLIIVEPGRARIRRSPSTDD